MAETDTSERRRWSWARTAWLLAAALVALGVAAAFLPDLLPESAVRQRVAEALSKTFGRPVTVTSARLAWDEGLTARGVEIGRRDGRGLLARADRLTVRFGPLEAAGAVAGRDVAIDTVRFDGLELWLELDEAGRLNVEDLAQGEPLRARAVQVSGGRVHFTNLATGGRLDFENVHVSVGELDTTGNGYVSLSADLCRVEAGEGESAPGEDPRPGRAARPAGSSVPTACGHVVLTANLDRLAFGPDEPPAGSLKAEWSDLPWGHIWNAVDPGSPLAGVLAATSGRMSGTFGRGTWSAEGAVQGTGLALAAADGKTPAALPQVILGFRLHQVSEATPLVIDLLKFSAPGLDLKVTGAVDVASLTGGDSARRVSAPAARQPNGSARAVGTETHRAGASAPASSTAAPTEPPPWLLEHAELHVDGAVSWVPLCQNAAPLRPLLDAFDRLGGTARLRLDVQTTDQGLQVTGSADLTDTVIGVKGRLEKAETHLLRAALEASCDRALTTLRLARLEVATDDGRLALAGTVPIERLLNGLARGFPPTDRDARLADWLAGAEMTLTAEAARTEGLLDVVPALGGPLGPLAVRGPFRLTAAVRPATPAQAGAAPASGPAFGPAWTATVRADLTAAAVSAPGGVHKAAKVPATLEAGLVVWPGVRRSDVRALTVRLGQAAAQWDGSARINWPRQAQEQPEGRFEGTLAVSDLASAGAILAPDRFAASPPVSGGATFDVAADLAEGRLRTHMNAGLEDLGLALGETLVKPAGQPASLAVTSLWYTGRWNHVEGEVDLDLPGVRLSALGQATLALEWHERPADGDAAAGEADADEPGAAAPAPDEPRSSFVAELVSPTTVELKAALSDPKRAAAISPMLERVLKDYPLAGRADGRVVLSLRPERRLQASGNLDLTEAALDLGDMLTKPAGVAFSARVTGDLAPQARGRIEVTLGTAEVRLGDSVARVSGRVLLDQAGLVADVAPRARLAAALDEADLRVEADWRHGADLGRMLPWLAPLYGRCNLEGLTRWTLAVTGTPTRGRVTLNVDATDCRVSAVAAAGAAARPVRAAGSGAVGTETHLAQREGAGAAQAARPVVIKEATVPASVALAMQYGEVPGEMVVQDLKVRLAEATASAQGRLLFADPRLLVPAPPTAWTLHVQGQVPDAAILASLLPSRLADLEPTGTVTVDLRAAADTKGAEVESCRLDFDAARFEWLGRTIRLDGPVAYDADRLQTEGLNLRVGGSDVQVVAYVSRPNEDPTGSLIVRGSVLDLVEVQEMIRETSEAVAAGRPAGAGDAGAVRDVSDRLGERLRGLLARAYLSVEVRLEHVRLSHPQWGAEYDLSDLSAEGRLADRRFVLPRFQCRLNQGTATGQMRLDFRQDVPVLDLTYEARDLQMADNLKPFIDTTFPGMQVFASLSTRETLTQRLAEGAHRIGRGETVLVDGLLEGPGAPDYIAAVLPGLKLTRYEFNRMTNVFEHNADGSTDNRMIFDGKAYDVYIFGTTDADGRTRYTLGVDLSVSLGSDVISRTLDQGKLPLMHYNGRLVGSKFAEQQISYVLPHEFAYDVFLRRNLLLQLIRSLGEKEPEITRPLVVPDETPRTPGG